MNTETLPPRKIPRIVLLEDDRSFSSLLKHCLHEWFEKIELVRFAGGDQAWLELSLAKPDLLILDWKHPGLTGHEMLELLAVDQARFPILLTSELFDQHFQLFSDQGLKLKFLPKPFHIWEFWAALNELVGPSDFPKMQAIVKTHLSG
jgi:DNA-binding response OmpR family regulator